MDHIYDHPSFGQNWFSYPNLYASMVEKFPSGSKFVEVGSWKGRSSAYMAVEICNSNKNIEFYCVDHWKGNEECYDPNHHAYEPEIDKVFSIFTENMKPVDDYYVPIKMSSQKAPALFPDKSLDFVFIDAAHDFENVILDIFAWAPKIKDNGILAGHDIQYDPVKDAVNKAIGESNYFVLESEMCWVVNNVREISVLSLLN